ncbi:hypothetical protein CLV92_10230 [Kineococcus xinjiangensis]|uniref:Uncharacterized protein n=1 Tax=Kineococcus xinjiangensis TaxID=512762 RepID=A0A2S6IUD1_9ACTN|nr:hypothetical protein [Kineococcus xinjiangensis]PPK97880.1 hypothetical protein CLV92_10230 [Kineococcus xinjiangensis]
MAVDDDGRPAGTPPEPPSEELLEFLLAALAQATDCVVPRRGLPLPFAVLEQPDGRHLHRFAGEMVRAQETARGWIREQPDVRMACVAWDGYLTLEGVRTDAVFVDGCDDGDGDGYVFVQRYVPAEGSRGPMVALGRPGLVRRSERLFDR